MKKNLLTLKFILGCLDEFKESAILRSDELLLWDKMFLAHLKNSCMQIENYIENYNQVTAGKMLCHLIDEDLSALYFTSVKDRLYCSGKCSLERTSVQTVFYYTLHWLSRLLSPVLPVTFEKAYAQYPHFAKRGDASDLSVFENNFINPAEIDISGENEYGEALACLLRVRGRLLSQLGSGGHKMHLVTLSLQEQLEAFRIIQVSQLFLPCDF